MHHPRGRYYYRSCSSSCCRRQLSLKNNLQFFVVLLLLVVVVATVSLLCFFEQVKNYSSTRKIQLVSIDNGLNVKKKQQQQQTNNNNNLLPLLKLPPHDCLQKLAGGGGGGGGGRSSSSTSSSKGKGGRSSTSKGKGGGGGYWIQDYNYSFMKFLKDYPLTIRKDVFGRYPSSSSSSLFDDNGFYLPGTYSWINNVNDDNNNNPTSTLSSSLSSSSESSSCNSSNNNKNNNNQIQPITSMDGFCYMTEKLNIESCNNNNNNKNNNNNQIQPITSMDEFCYIMTNKLNIDRFFFVGDSLTKLQYDSLMNILYVININDKKSKSNNNNSTYTNNNIYNLQQPRNEILKNEILLECPSPTNNSSNSNSAGGGNHTSSNMTTKNNIIKFVLHKNDKLTLDIHTKRCAKGICMAWYNDYLYDNGGGHNNTNSSTTTTSNGSGGGRTVLVANTGVHLHHHVAFESRFDSFYNQLSTTTIIINENENNDNENDNDNDEAMIIRQRQRRRRIVNDDIKIFRTTAPGHIHCTSTADSKPYTDDTLFYNTLGQDSYDWSKMESYNDYAKERIFGSTTTSRNNNNNNNNNEDENENENNDNSSRDNNNNNNNNNWIVLDIVPMTILRPDGHKDPPKDCLHYHLPSVIDWWNHLLYTTLLEIANYN